MNKTHTLSSSTISYHTYRLLLPSNWTFEQDEMSCTAWAIYYVMSLCKTLFIYLTSAQNSMKNETTKQGYFEKCRSKKLYSLQQGNRYWKTCSVAFKILSHGFFLTFNNQCKTITKLSDHGHSSPVMAHIYYNLHELDFLLAPVDYINTQSKM